MLHTYISIIYVKYVNVRLMNYVNQQFDTSNKLCLIRSILILLILFYLECYKSENFFKNDSYYKIILNMLFSN